MEEEKRFHVLAVDDSMIDRKLLQRLLTLSSYRVTFVESGDEALEYLGLNGIRSDDDIDPLTSSSQHKEVKVNLIMTDYCMPGMNGYDLLRRLKGSSWKDVPVVVMSSENVPSRVSMCLEGGAEEFLLKPLQMSDLEKLQPYLTKSNDACSKSISKGSDKSSRHEEDQMNVTRSNSNNNNFNNEASTKRKAVSKDTPDKRHKIQQQAVV